MKIILASTSKYRAQLVAKLGLPFEAVKPLADEEIIKSLLIAENASPIEIAETLSKQKGSSIQSLYPNDVIICGDQLVNFHGKILGKPGSKENAIEQLLSLNNQTHELVTSTTIIADGKLHHNNNITKMKMKNLTEAEIRAYVELDNPVDCAGSIKIESYGITLFEKIESSDFSAIQGLPLIWISNTLKGLGYELFKK
jgi:septum formation protein